MSGRRGSRETGARSVATSAAVGAGVVAATLAAAFGIQAATLPPPARGARAAVRATAWFLRYRYVESAFRIDGGPLVRGRCLDGWLPVGHGRRARGAILVLSDGRTIVTAPKLRILGDPHAQPNNVPLVVLEASGCPHLDGSRLSGIVQGAHAPDAVDTVLAGRRVIALRVPTRTTQLTIGVDPHTGRPVAVAARSARHAARGTIRLTRLTPATLHAMQAAAGP